MKPARRSDDLVSRRSPVCERASSLPAAALLHPLGPLQTPSPRSLGPGTLAPGPGAGQSEPRIPSSGELRSSTVWPCQAGRIPDGTSPEDAGENCSPPAATRAARTCGYGQPGPRHPESAPSRQRAGRPRGALPACLSTWLRLTPVRPPVPTYGRREFPFSFKLLWVVVL